jgi:hypothetical protein
MIIMVCDGSGLDELSLVWQAVGRAVIRWTELAELKEGGQSSFQCVIQFLRLAPYFIPQPVLRIRIRIHIFLGHPDPFVRGMDPDQTPDPDLSIIMQKYGSKKTFDSYYFVTLFGLFLYK